MRRLRFFIPTTTNGVLWAGVSCCAAWLAGGSPAGLLGLRSCQLVARECLGGIHLIGVVYEE